MIQLVDDEGEVLSEEQCVELLGAHERHEACGASGPSPLEQAVTRTLVLHGMSSDDPEFESRRATWTWYCVRFFRFVAEYQAQHGEPWAEERPVDRVRRSHFATLDVSPVDERGESIGIRALVELDAQHHRDKATPGFSGPTELERVAARTLAEVGEPEDDVPTLVVYWQLTEIRLYKRAQELQARRARAREGGRRRTRSQSRRRPRLEREPRVAVGAEEAGEVEASGAGPGSFRWHEPTPRSGAHARYELRRAWWRDKAPTLWRLRHAGWWWLHNVVVHPLLGLLPVAAMVRLHDWSSARLSRSPSLASPLPRIPHRWRWIVHNVGAHLAIGLVPCAMTFRWHDQTAKRMQVPGWV
ncbi:hypothetical protein [Paraliomyxa miuraensis]|uniref:hypothetical protein n=1 Tax=Paraliomyxa miuraensis TaxID=376150 RepID=UPI0022536346|nr:hypothetical protein [Paraliomyxa miuraensis]MCX4245623.1 hypothetical protein [Paraliomyxa miuraensis]